MTTAIQRIQEFFQRRHASQKQTQAEATQAYREVIQAISRGEKSPLGDEDNSLADLLEFL